MLGVTRREANRVVYTPCQKRKPTLVGLKENQRINPMQSKLPRQRVSHHRLRCMLAQPCIRDLARPVTAACLQG